MIHKSYGKLNIIFVVFIILFTTKFFNYSNWNPTYAGWCSYFIYGYLALSIFNKRAYLENISSPISKWVKWSIGLHLPCLVTMMIIYGQFPFAEKSMVFQLMLFLFYYYYYINHIPESVIIKIFTGISLIIFIIQVVQQIFPGMAVFGVFTQESHGGETFAEIRNGLFRYRLSGSLFVLFCLYYYWAKLLDKISIKNVIIFLIFFISMYLFLTRQIMFATIATLALSSFFVTNKKSRFIFIAITAIFVGLIFIYSDVLFGELINKTQDEFSDENIRIVAFVEYWERITANPLVFLFGNGHPPEFYYLQDEFGLFTSDIGFVGELYHYGVLWIFFYFYALYCIIIKYRKLVPLYIRLFLFGTAINSIMIFPCRFPYEFFLWASVLYICSLHVCSQKARSNRMIQCLE